MEINEFNRGMEQGILHSKAFVDGVLDANKWIIGWKGIPETEIEYRNHLVGLLESISKELDRLAKYYGG